MNVLVFEQERGLARRWVGALKERGVRTSVCHDQNSCDEILSNQPIHLLICVTAKKDPGNAHLEGVWETYPFLPTLNISTALAVVHRSDGTGLHDNIRHLAPLTTFWRKIRNLLRDSRLFIENTQLKQALLLVNRLEEAVGTVGMDEFVSRSIGFLAKELQAEQVYWLRQGEFEYYVREMWKVQSLDGDMVEFARQPELHSWRRSSVNVLSDLLQRVQGDLPLHWNDTEVPFILTGGLDIQDETLFIPLYGEGKVMGHYVILNPEEGGAKSLGNTLPLLTKGLGRVYSASQAIEEAKELSYIDDLTALYNQRYLKLVLDKEITRAERGKDVFSVMFIDIDHFKRVNDSEGHLVGSNILVQLSEVLNSNIRATDYGFRYGGDEFLLVLVGSAKEEAREVGERIRKQVEETVFKYEGVELQVTLSIGIASFPEHAKTRAEIIRLADEAMYYGKNKSRNIVFVAS